MTKILKATENRQIYMELPNGYFIKVGKNQLVRTLKAMKKGGEDFEKTNINLDTPGFVFITVN